mgnify:CR=1 FL=1
MKILSGLSIRGIFNSPPAGVKKEFKKLWKDFGVGHDIRWLTIYGSISGIWDPRYVPETIYYNHIEPRLNDKSFSKAWTDKNFCQHVLKEFNLPVTILKNAGGVYYDANNLQISRGMAMEIIEREDRFIIKPSVDSGGGKDVFLLTKTSDGFSSGKVLYRSPDEILSFHKKNFIVQEVIDQHPFYSSFNPSSVNTVRFLTYRSVKDEKVNILNVVFRVGKEGSITDNQASGGYACGMTPDGRLTGRAVTKEGMIFDNVNGIFLEPGLKLEAFNKMAETALKTAHYFPYSRLIGMDICLDKFAEVILIEVNNLNNEINFYQMLGKPLFGEFTDEIINYCRNARKSFMIDFEI